MGEAIDYKALKAGGFMKQVQKGYGSLRLQTVGGNLDAKAVQKVAEVAEKYVRKGARVYIEGKIKSRTYEDKMGNRRYITEIYAEDMQILTRPQTQEGQQPVQNQQQYGANQYSAPAAQTFAQPAPQPVEQPVAEPVAQPFIGAPTGMDDDLPF